MPKRKREYICHITCGLDVWTIILKYDLFIQLNMSLVNKYYYFHFGGAINLIQRASESPRESSDRSRNVAFLTRAAQSAQLLDVLLPIMRWNYITKNDENGKTNPSELIMNLFCEMYPTIVSFLQTNNNLVLAGGFARSIVISALQKYISSTISNQTNDLDFFAKDTGELIQCAIDLFGPNFHPIWDDSLAPPMEWQKKLFYRTNVVEIKAPNSLHQTKNIQFINTPFGMQKATKKGHAACLINGFDFTPTQVSFNGKNVFVTPAFLYSLFTGKMYLSYFLPLGWPFKRMETEYIRPGEPTVCESQKRNMIQRFFKYKLLGYKSILLSKEEEDRLYGFYNDPGWTMNHILNYNDGKFDFVERLFL